MRITVFGANGRVGSLVVGQCLDTGHYVTAFVHGSSTFPKHKNLQVVQGNIYHPADVAKAIDGSEVVISALGSWGTPKKDVLTVGMRHVIPAMQARGITRIISLTGADALATGDSISLLTKLSRPALLLLAKKILIDGEQHIKLLEQSRLAWTVIRSPVMTERGDPNKFRLSHTRPFPWHTINRHSVAQAMVTQLDSDGFLQKAPFIKRC